MSESEILALIANLDDSGLHRVMDSVRERYEKRIGAEESRHKIREGLSDLDADRVGSPDSALEFLNQDLG
jgi:hypothetical protein